MLKLTDGTSTIEIEMQVWDGTNYSPDLTADFFAWGALPHAADGETCIVEDVGYCIGQAEDWKNRRGDFYEDADADDGERVVRWKEV